MERQEIFDKIKDIIGMGLEVEKVDFSEETHLRDDLGADSLDVFDMGCEIDREFGIKTEAQEMEGRWDEITVGYLVDLVQKKMERGG